MSQNISPEQQFINDRFEKHPESNILKESRKNFEAAFPPKHIIEFFLPPEELEKNEVMYQKSYRQELLFFHKEEKDKIHLLVFYNIKNIAKIFKDYQAKYGGLSINSLSNIDTKTVKEGISDGSIELEID